MLSADPVGSASIGIPWARQIRNTGRRRHTVNMRTVPLFPLLLLVVLVSGPAVQAFRVSPDLFDSRQGVKMGVPSDGCDDAEVSPLSTGITRPADVQHWRGSQQSHEIKQMNVRSCYLLSYNNTYKDISAGRFTIVMKPNHSCTDAGSKGPSPRSIHIQR